MRRLEAHHHDLLNIMGEGILDGGGDALPHSLRALHCMRRQGGGDTGGQQRRPEGRTPEKEETRGGRRGRDQQRLPEGEEQYDPDNDGAEGISKCA